MRSRPWLATLSILIAAATVGGCKKKGGGGSWLVGEGGTMVELGPDGDIVGGYDLATDDDLLAIACRGATDAFVVGEGGTMLRSFDGGASWDALDLGVGAATLRDVAAAHQDVVHVAGDGVLARSDDSGDTWTLLDDGDWRSVAIDDAGGIMVAVDDRGEVWRGGVDEPLERVASVPGARAVTIGHGGGAAAVVGDRGAIAISDDGGRSWRAVITGSDADLHAAWATGDGGVIAVGAAGTLLRVRGDEVSPLTAGAKTLRAVHLDADGHGLAAGDDGALLVTNDGGDSWAPLEVELSATIYGLDEIGEPHF